MYFGVPIISSDLDVLREIAADAAQFIPQKDVHAWSTRMISVLQSNKETVGMVDAGKKRLKHFSWERAAIETIEVFKEAIKT